MRIVCDHCEGVGQYPYNDGHLEICEDCSGTGSIDEETGEGVESWATDGHSHECMAGRCYC